MSTLYCHFFGLSTWVKLSLLGYQVSNETNADAVFSRARVVQELPDRIMERFDGSIERLANNVFLVPLQISNDSMEGSVLIGSVENYSVLVEQMPTSAHVSEYEAGMLVCPIKSRIP